MIRLEVTGESVTRSDDSHTLIFEDMAAKGRWKEWDEIGEGREEEDEYPVNGCTFGDNY